MLKHTYLSPVKRRSKSQSSETSVDDPIDSINQMWYQSDDDVCKTTRQHTRTRVSRRRPPSGTDNAVRRWNSFHSTRGECHPNKFRRDRKSTSPSIDLGRRCHGSPSRTWELRRGKSLAEKSTTFSKTGFLSALASPSDQAVSSIW